MSYEAECEAYALHGDPQRDAMDYEEAARFDRFDGWGDPDCEDPCDPDGMVGEPAALPVTAPVPVPRPASCDDVPF